MDTGVLGKIMVWDCVTEGTGIAKMGSGDVVLLDVLLSLLCTGAAWCVWESGGDEEMFGEMGR